MCVLKKISVFMNHEIFGSGGVATLMKSSFRRKKWLFYSFSCDNRETSYYDETMNSSFFQKQKILMLGRHKVDSKFGTNSKKNFKIRGSVSASLKFLPHP